MKRHVLGRYERDTDGCILIDVTAARAEDLYNNFDRSAPYVTRDLDQDLVEYLVGCARELGREPFVIRFTLTDPPDDSRVQRIQRSVVGYFRYLGQLERQRLLHTARRSLMLVGLGVGLLLVSFWIQQSAHPETSTLRDLFLEGLTVAAWISLWEAFATFIVEWPTRIKDLRLHRRLAAARLVFGTPARPGEQGEGGGESGLQDPGEVLVVGE
jgi:hypothetical protein